MRLRGLYTPSGRKNSPLTQRVTFLIEEGKRAAMLLPLSTVPTLKQVDTDIFSLRYYAKCMQCTFCHDSCCQYGCDVNIGERERILALASEIKPFVSTPPERWFKAESSKTQYPTGRFVRSEVVDGRCVFLSRDNRGCGLHSFALKTGRDYHDVKPMVCWLFPVCWDKGVLRPSSDIRDDLQCKGDGPTVYEMTRPELLHVFGKALVEELDALKLRA